MYCAALEHAIWRSVERWAVLWDVISVICVCFRADSGRSKVISEMSWCERDRSVLNNLGKVWQVMSEESAQILVQQVSQRDRRYCRKLRWRRSECG